MTSSLGILVIIAFAWSISSHRGRISWRIVAGGLLLQFVFALAILLWPPGRQLFETAGLLFHRANECVDVATSFLFDFKATQVSEGTEPVSKTYFYQLVHSVAFRVLPTIIFFSSLMAGLYHLGVMQRIVAAFAWVMQKTLGTSGAESLSAAANIFVGQTEAPLVVRPYVADMTLSELNAVMVGGFATIAGGVLAVYVSMGIDAAHLISASVISAPAGLLIAKIMEPEIGTPRTLGTVRNMEECRCVNLIEAISDGASEGMKLALNVAAMLIAFLALIAMMNGLVGWVGTWFGGTGTSVWTMEKGLGYLFYPFAWLMGIPISECRTAGELLGIRTVTNEFIAYQRLSEWQAGNAPRLSERTEMILTYALCGFANFGSIGIQIGGIGGIAPGRRSDLARIGLRAMIGGMLACFLTACVAGIVR